MPPDGNLRIALVSAPFEEGLIANDVWVDVEDPTPEQVEDLKRHYNAVIFAKHNLTVDGILKSYSSAEGESTSGSLLGAGAHGRGAMDGVDFVIAQHVDPLSPVGTIGINAGPSSGGVDSWFGAAFVPFLSTSFAWNTCRRHPTRLSPTPIRFAAATSSASRSRGRACGWWARSALSSTTSSGSVKIWKPAVPSGCKVPIVHFAHEAYLACANYEDALAKAAGGNRLGVSYQEEAPKPEEAVIEHHLGQAETRHITGSGHGRSQVNGACMS